MPKASTSTNIENVLFHEIAAPSTPAANYNRLFFSSADGHLHYIDDAGNDVTVTDDAGEVELTDLANYSRGLIIRGGAADWEAYSALTAGAVLIGDGTDVISTVDPTFTGTLTIPNVGLHILDTNASHDLIISPGSNLTADRTLSIVTGDASRTITLSGNPTLADWFDQAVKVASSPTFGGLDVSSDAAADTVVRIEATTDGRASSLYLIGNQTGQDGGVGKIIGFNQADSLGYIYFLREDEDNSGEIAFGVQNAGSMTEAVRINKIGHTGFGTTEPNRLIHPEVADAVTAAVTYAQRLSHITSGTATTGFGVGVEFELEGADASNLVAGVIELLWTNAGAGAEDADMVFKVSTGGAVASEILRLASDNEIIVTGDIDPEADGTRDLGTQTTAQWANVWSDLINGSEICLENGWRMMESELYGYPAGFALGHSNKWQAGVSIWHSDSEQRQVFMADEAPAFAVTDKFIEWKGRRITAAILDRLLELVN